MNVYRLSRHKVAVILFWFAMLPAARAETSPAGGPQQRAAAALEQALKADPANPELWLHLGFAYRKLNQLDQAETAFQKAATINPHEEDAFYMIALIDEKKGQKKEAAQAWKNYMGAETDPVKRTVAQKHIHQLEQ